MDYHQGELQLLCETFAKCRITTALLHPGDIPNRELHEEFWRLFGKNTKEWFLTQEHFEKIAPQTLYRLTTHLRLTFLLLRLPHTAEETILSIGPYLSEPITPEVIPELGEEYGIPPHRQKSLEDYYTALPLLQESSHLFTMLNTFCERIWGGSNSFFLEDINEDFPDESPPLPASLSSESNDLLLDIKLMEERYLFENEMMQAVSKGQLHKSAFFMSSVSSVPFEKRLDDPLRNLKNYSIIMNTLLRKAAESGGVHPIHLNEMSSSFAAKIENLSSVGNVQKLMTEMFRAYCLLVRKHSTEKLSAIVQKTVLLIDADLSANLSLSTLAEAQNISAGYLSGLFKKEMGKTVTAYINEQRMKLAMHLLGATRLQIQTVAQHCGILDVQYFSKLFKKHTGKTPKEYRMKSKMEGSR